MKNIRIICDTRSVKKGGVSPVKIAIPHKGQTLLFSTGVDVMPCQFVDGRITNTSNRNQLNAILRTRASEIDNALLVVSQETPLNRLTANELRKRIDAIINPRAEEKQRIAPHIEERLANEKSRGDIIALRTHLQTFCKHYERLTYDEITRQWLEDFDKFLIGIPVARNTASGYLSKLRALFNYAINKGLTTNYPFRGFRLKHERTRSRALSLDQLRTLLNAECTPTEKKYLLFFELSLMLLGMNVSDIWKAKPPKYGRVTYSRSKTGQNYSVKVGKRAKEILREIGHTEHLTVASLSTRHSFNCCINVYLAKICERLEDFPTVTSYYARHTWATLAAEIGIPRHIIGAALGHAWTDVTGIYIGINEAQVDEASEAVEKYIYGE